LLVEEVARSHIEAQLDLTADSLNLGARRNPRND
jgi:hypothetical protein